MKGLILLGFVGLVITASTDKKERVKRQLNTNNCNFQTLPNPCSQGGQTFHAVATDNTKFIQCDSQGEMYVVQCPTGKHYDAGQNKCIITQQTFIPNGNTGVSGSGTGTGTTSTGNNNPCTGSNIANGNIYFAYQGDVHRFIECDPNGQPKVLTCPTHLRWDQGRKTCVYTFQAGQTHPPITTMASLTSTGMTTNPCKGLLFNGQLQFYPHPDPHKFIQCNVAGNAYVLSCPQGLVWNAQSSTCSSQYQG